MKKIVLAASMMLLLAGCGAGEASNEKIQGHSFWFTGYRKRYRGTLKS